MKKEKKDELFDKIKQINESYYAKNVTKNN